MSKIKPNDQLLSSLLNDLQLAEGPYKITNYWKTYNRRIVREISKHGIANLQSNHNLLKGFAEGGEPRIISPDNGLKRFVFDKKGIFATPRCSTNEVQTMFWTDFCTKHIPNQY